MPSPLLMGIINVTPDSFSDGGQFLSPDAAIEHGLRLIDEGADIIDIGGESTRPYAEIIHPDEECSRVIPVIAGLKPHAITRGIAISIDTRNARTMHKAIQAGADMINDISALTHDPDSIKVAAGCHARIILMHMQGTPQTMQKHPHYHDVVKDVCDYLKQRIHACTHAGIATSRIIIDPGLGFGKTVEHNIALFNNIATFKNLGTPVLIGASRKSFLATIAGLKDGQSRLATSLAASIMAAGQGADILRVHDIAETRQALTVWQGLGRIDNAP